MTERVPAVSGHRAAVRSFAELEDGDLLCSGQHVYRVVHVDAAARRLVLDMLPDPAPPRRACDPPTEPTTVPVPTYADPDATIPASSTPGDPA